MTRIDLYRNVHKGQRALLFELAVELGRTDGAEPAAFAAVAERMHDAIAELRRHAENEERYIHPLLLARAPEIAAALEREHRNVEGALVELEERLRTRDAMPETPPARDMELYRAWCRMLSAYLTHLDTEECQAMPALWKTCSDEEILAVIRAFVSGRTTADQLHDLRSQVPALTARERALYVGSVVSGGMLTGESILHCLADVLPRAALARLQADLGAS